MRQTQKRRASLRGLFLLIVLTTAIRGQSPGNIGGVVKDTTGAAVAQATVSMLNARQAVIATTVTNARGEFALQGAAPGTYEILVAGHRGFAPKRVAITVTPAGAAPVEIVLGAERLTAEVTVTAEIGIVQSLDQTTQQVNVIEEDELAQRAKAVTAQIAQDEPGLQLQRTSASIGAIFVRGVTGAKVVSYVDGIRISTSTARGGINTFFNLNDVTNLRAVEVIRGPNSAQFGSDSIGGSVQLISRAALYTAGPPEVHGQIGTHYNSADHSFGGNALLTAGNKDLAVMANLVSRRSNTVRPGGGFESHSAVTRFLGVRSDLLLGERSTDTAFTQYGGLFKLS